MAKQRSTKAGRKAKRNAKLHKQGNLVRGVHVPPGAIPANPDEQAKPQSLSVKYFYTDIDYTCRSCGKLSTWTALQQKRYFEIQKGNCYNKPTWCTPCQKERVRIKYGPSD